jgi:hypothetical protein
LVYCLAPATVASSILRHHNAVTWRFFVRLSRGYEGTSYGKFSLSGAWVVMVGLYEQRRISWSGQ